QHPPINNPRRQPPTSPNRRNRTSPILPRSPPRQNRPTVNPTVQRIERAQHIIPLTEEDEEAIATPTPEVEENIREELLNIVNNFDNLNIHVAQNLSIEIESTNPELPTMNPQQLKNLLQALTAAVTNNNQLQQQPNQQASAVNIPRIAVQIPIFKGDPRENVSASLMQVQTIFETQGIDLVTIRCQYASTGMKGAAIHW